MNDEIKEILDELKDYSEHEYLPPCCELTNEECKHLLDYITNLQQENNNLKTSLDESQEVVIDLQQRIEKAVEYIHKNYYEIVYKTKGTLENDLLNILNGRSDE